MAFRKNPESRPQISDVSPPAAIPGGEFRIRGKGLAGAERPTARFGELSAPVVIGSDSLVIVRVPEGVSRGELMLGKDDDAAWTCDIGIQIADGLHPVSNPAVDKLGNIYTTFSGSAGQKTPVSIYKIDTSLTAKPLVTDLMNATGLALDAEGVLYSPAATTAWSIRFRRRATRRPTSKAWAWPPASSFDRDDNLYVGDRSGTVFKISRQRQIYVFATLEPSIAAYHLAFGPDGYLYVTGPTTSSFDAVHRIRQGRARRDVLSRAGPSAGHGVRRRRQPVRRGIARRAARRGADYAGTQSRAVSLRTGHRGPGVFAVEVGDRGHQQFAVRVDVGIEGWPVP